MARSDKLELLFEKFQAGDRLALSRIISLVEDRRPGFERVLEQIFPLTGKGHRIGMTGPPGAGKSTLTEKLSLELRKRDKSIGIIAVDPTSPFTGGAILGDRIRMQAIGLDPNIFIRSMATRGSLGGLAMTTQEVADILDGFGKEVVIMETVGVGQSELDIASAADTTVVVLVPESGDGVQAMKAGLMEIADIFVVNKSDREGAEGLAREIEAMLSMQDDTDGWNPCVIQTVAVADQGVTELCDAIFSHYENLVSADLLKKNRRKRIRNRIKDVINQRVESYLWNTPEGQDALDRAVGEIEAGWETPYTIAATIITQFGLGKIL